MSWQTLGDAIFTGAGDSALAASASGELEVLFTQSDGLHVALWSGSPPWNVVASEPYQAPDVLAYPQLANHGPFSDHGGHLTVSYVDSGAFRSGFVDVLHWDGLHFQAALGVEMLNPFSPSQQVGSLRLALDGGANPIVAFVAQTPAPNAGTKLFVFRGDSTGFTELAGEPLAVGPDIALAVDSRNRPVVLYHDGGANPSAFVLRWDGLHQWLPLGSGPVASGSTHPLAIDSRDRPVTAGTNGVVWRSNQ
jgi:hypothetical protein